MNRLTPDHTPPPPDHSAALGFALRWEESSVADAVERDAAAPLEEVIAAISVTAPHRAAPAAVLPAVKSRLASTPAAPKVNGSRSGLRALPPPAFSLWRCVARAGWPLAACLAVLTTWQGVRVVRLGGQVETLKADLLSAGGARSAGTGAGSGPHGDNAADPSTASQGSAPGDGSFVAGPQRHGPLHRARRSESESMVVPDRAALERQLNDLKLLAEGRFRADPSVARTVVMELKPPGAKPAAANRTLSTEVADIIAAGLDKGKSAAPPAAETNKNAPPVPAAPPLTISGHNPSRPGDELVIREGLPNLNSLRISPQTSVLHENFPVENWQHWEGLHLLQDGTYYDELDNRLWRRLPGDGHRFVGETPQSPIDLTTQAAPRDAVAPAPQSAPSNVTPAVPQPVVTEPARPPLMWTIYDESTGHGSMLVQDLPPPPEGQSYQLWFEDTLKPAEPISPGLLPALSGGYGRVDFPLQPGVSPVRYWLTLEPGSGSRQPTGNIVLHGP